MHNSERSSENVFPGLVNEKLMDGETKSDLDILFVVIMLQYMKHLRGT